MTYSIEKPRDSNLEDTAIPNLYIIHFLPDSPDGDYVKVYIYAYMCCKQGLSLTHEELADRLGIAPSKIIEAWQYYAERRIVKLTPDATGGDMNFDIEFVDVKGVLYGKVNGDKERPAGTGELNDAELAGLFQKIMTMCGDVTFDGSDIQRIISWIDDGGATHEAIESAWLYCFENNKPMSVNYVETIVRDWTLNGVKTAADAEVFVARRIARTGVHKKLMKALGLQFRAPTPAEEKKFNLWMDDFGYTPDRLLELAEGCAGAGNPMQYLEGIIRRERRSEGKSTDGMSMPALTAGQRQRIAAETRSEYYENERAKNEEIQREHLREVYEKVPEIERLDNELVRINNELVKAMISQRPDKQAIVEGLNQKTEQLAAERGRILAAAGFDPDYTATRHTCPTCSDSGILENGAACGCYTSLPDGIAR